MTTDADNVDRFFTDLKRWIAELGEQHDPRSTLWYGVAQRAFAGFDHFLGWAISKVVDSHPEAARPIIDTVLINKSLDKATLGQKVNILQALDRDRMISSRQLLTKADKKALSRLNVDRNAAAHEYGWEAGPAETLALLRILQDLSSRLRHAVEDGDPSAPPPRRC